MGLKLTKVFWQVAAAFLLVGMVLLSASCAPLKEFLQGGPSFSEADQTIPGGRRVPIPPTVDDLGVNN
ncbi:MAG: hypothetical protein HY913_09045 [Desulfomonile tiedjei]|nr:hypothetical protein [Desulfomonile tiedjei]